MTNTEQAIRTAVARQSAASAAAVATLGLRRTAAVRALWAELDAAEWALTLAVRNHEQAVRGANPTLSQREVMTLALAV